MTFIVKVQTKIWPAFNNLAWITVFPWIAQLSMAYTTDKHQPWAYTEHDIKITSKNLWKKWTPFPMVIEKKEDVSIYRYHYILLPLSNGIWNGKGCSIHRSHNILNPFSNGYRNNEGNQYIRGIKFDLIRMWFEIWGAEHITAIIFWTPY